MQRDGDMERERVENERDGDRDSAA